MRSAEPSWYNKAMIAERIKQLVALNPQSGLQPNVKQLCDMVGQQLSALGFVVTPLEYEGVHSLYAHPTGARHSRLLLQAHIDVVPATDQPFKEASDKLFGRGVYDMLYATACYLELLNDIRELVPSLDLGIMLSGDEELGGFNGVQKFLEDSYTTDICLLPDAGEGFGSLNVAAKGIYTLEVRAHGVAHHGSRPWEGDGAAAKLVHFLANAERAFDASSRDNSTMTIARLQAGDAENKGPATADATLDIRYKDKADLERIKQELQPLCQQFEVEIVSVKDGDDYQLDLHNADVQNFVRLYEQIAGDKIRFTKAHGSSDARFFASQGTPVIMFRPDGGGAHGDNEWLSKSSLDLFYKLLKEYVLSISVVK